MCHKTLERGLTLNGAQQRLVCLFFRATSLHLNHFKVVHSSDSLVNNWGDVDETQTRSDTPSFLRTASFILLAGRLVRRFACFVRPWFFLALTRGLVLLRVDCGLLPFLLALRLKGLKEAEEGFEE